MLSKNVVSDIILKAKIRATWNNVQSRADKKIHKNSNNDTRLGSACSASWAYRKCIQKFYCKSLKVEDYLEGLSGDGNTKLTWRSGNIVCKSGLDYFRSK